MMATTSGRIDPRVARQALALAFDGILHIDSPMWTAVVPYAGRLSTVAHVAASSASFPASSFPRHLWEHRDTSGQPVWKSWLQSRILRWPPPANLPLDATDEEGWCVAHHWVARRGSIPKDKMDEVMTIRGPLGIPAAHMAAPHHEFYPMRRYLLLADDYGLTTAHVLARLGVIIDPMPWGATTSDRLSVAEVYALNYPPPPNMPDGLPIREDIIAISPYAEDWTRKLNR